MGGAGQYASWMTGAMGRAMEGQANKEDLAFQAEQARQNALRSEVAAVDAEERGAAEAAQIQSKGTQTIATGRVATAASGIELDSPTATRVAETTRAYATLDARTTKANAAREAWGYRQEGEQYKAAEKQYTKKSKSALTPWSVLFG